MVYLNLGTKSYGKFTQACFTPRVNTVARHLTINMDDVHSCHCCDIPCISLHSLTSTTWHDQDTHVPGIANDSSKNAHKRETYCTVSRKQGDFEPASVDIFKSNEVHCMSMYANPNMSYLFIDNTHLSPTLERCYRLSTRWGTCRPLPVSFSPRV